MGWLIGNDAKSYDLIIQYWTMSDTVLPQFSKFIENTNIFMNDSELLDLHKLTYLDNESPFGKVDLHSRVGMVRKTIDKTFIEEIDKSLNIIREIKPLATLLQLSVKKFIPLTEVGSQIQLRENGSGKSAHWFKGAIFLSLPKNHEHRSLELALNIVHEIGHQVLMIFQDCDNLIVDINQPVYSTIRKTNRPAIMSLHALVAVYFMIFLLKNTSTSTLAEQQYVENKLRRLNSDFIAGAFALKNIEFTELGNKIFSEMISYVIANSNAA